MVKIMSDKSLLLEYEGWELLRAARNDEWEPEESTGPIGGVDVRFSELTTEEEELPEIDLSLLDEPMEEYIPASIDNIKNGRKLWWEFAGSKKDEE